MGSIIPLNQYLIRLITEVRQNNPLVQIRNLGSNEHTARGFIVRWQNGHAHTASRCTRQP
jgi:hypothetical protein